MWNRIATLIVLVATVSLFLTPIEVEARGGGGRGGGGRSGGGRSTAGASGGGAYRGGNTMNRTPTMSRASSKPTVTQTRQQTQNRSSLSQGRVQQSRQTLQQRPSVEDRAELRNQVNQYAQNRPTQNVDRQNLTQKTQTFSSQRSNQITQNRQLSDNVSQRLQQSRPDYNHWFDRNFFDQHNIDMGYLGTGSNLWRPAAWASLATWGAWNWSTPYYYDDGGYAYPITTAGSTYPSTTTTPYQPAQTQPRQNLQTTASTGGDWLPLGVFAVASNAHAAAQTNRFIQLAISRSGEIAGVLYNSTTDVAQDLAGIVNNDTQKAYWSFSNRPGAPVASTGVYNLTEDQTPINVHFSDGSDQVWTLVRLQQG